MTSPLELRILGAASSNIGGFKMSQSCSRRVFVQQLGLSAGILAILPHGKAFAAGEPHVAPTDPMAVAMGYVEDATKVDPKTAGFAPNRNCANCLQLTGTPGDAFRPCKIFPGKVVNSKGWCKAWAAQI